MIVSDAPNCGVSYDRQSDDHNSFIIQATGQEKKSINVWAKCEQKLVCKFFVNYEQIVSKFVSKFVSK